MLDKGSPVWWEGHRSVCGSITVEKFGGVNKRTRRRNKKYSNCSMNL